MTTRYADRFQHEDAVSFYEAGEYEAGSYSSCIWRLQRPVVEQLVKDFRAAQPGPVRLLDFACGTGRVLASLESTVGSAEGIDISPEMLAVARTKCTRARLQVGDILTQPDLPGKNYDVITAFRFLLNVEPEIRRRVLRRLRELIRPIYVRMGILPSATPSLAGNSPVADDLEQVAEPRAPRRTQRRRLPPICRCDALSQSPMPRRR